MRLIKNFANHRIAVVIVVVLLAVQAFCDLSLPNYTSDIVDVGIQQSGVEHASTDALTERTHDLVAIMESEQNESLFADSYSQRSDGAYELTDFGREHRAELDDAMSMPLVAVHYADQTGMDLDQLKAAYDAGMVQKSDVQTMLDEAKSQMGDMADSIVDQQAIAAAKAEYEQLGYDLNAMQMNYLLTTGGKMLGLAALGMVIAVIVGFIASRTAAKIGASLRSRLFERVLSFSDAEIQSFSAASLITRGTNDVQQVQMVSVMMLRMILYAPILAIGGIIMIARTNLSMGWIIVAAVLAIAVVMLFLMKVAMPKFKIMQKLIDRVNLVSREILTGIPVVRAFGREAHEEERFDEANLRLMKTQLFTNRVMTFMMPLMMLIMNLVSVAIIWFGGHAVDSGTLQTGDLIAFITYSMVIIMGFLMIGMLSIMLPRADVAAQRIDEVLKTESSIADPSTEVCRDDELAVRTGGAEIAFNDVSFRYPGSQDCVLEHVDFTAKPGQTTAIIGSTGSGKSTVIKLVERFADVSEGSITIDGIDIRDLSLHALRGQLGYVPQKAFLFSGTVEENVDYAADELNAERVRVAAEIAQADFVDDMDEGFKTEISQGGTNVSGGQRQRLAIARALATDARAFLFDDSFSALDYKTDAALRHALAEQLGGKTQIIVAQRISTVLHADQIVVLDEGRVVGCGTHAELMDACEPYREIALSQLSEEELEEGDAQ
ncbi:ABC transporter ATP-binding protein [Slackia isoflavoniconvertens]|uniref:ABC transporter ATP-binding protein n=1 Tax=Slackia isoflavoniconvertens TaxID=572010 RepID=A0A369LK46_9ACTN|nr:ABC transporter ATP-binding protein [Slackia isoflavoniconvertens]RDB59057.1 ABC transporter ATP-binding protein [Slackia isoflavoniconvertens]